MNDDMQRSGLDASLQQSLLHALRGAVFPLSVEQLGWLARENEAPAVVLTLLGGLPRGDFASASAVQQGVETLVASAESPAVAPPGPPASR